MQVRVSFRFNRENGEVEEFLVEDQDSRLPSAEHNRQHDHIAAALGRLLQQHPQVQILPGKPAEERDTEPAQSPDIDNLPSRHRS